MNHKRRDCVASIAVACLKKTMVLVNIVGRHFKKGNYNET